ncbi:twist-related protein 2-like [Parasteatoda tepidariorum]|uniref:Twist n=2 Tax=Parasteatoda tepidariorum TaxID=114398 RepID=Q65YY8_PARTP|nr:twist-related protein 2-like [Parasteatoda tepidariorum]BAD51393.1 Twist [Parasteatoda tepidariorum]
MGILPCGEDLQSPENRDSFIHHHRLPNLDSSMFVHQPQDLSIRVMNQTVQKTCSDLTLQNRKTVGYHMSVPNDFLNQFPRSNPFHIAINQTRSRRPHPYDRFRKKISPDSSSSSSGDPQIQRAQANNRERQRTQQLNSFFSDLRRKVPSLPSDKLSKIQTLRFAMDYIQFLNHVLSHGLELMSGDVPESWTSSTYLTHELLSREFLFRRMQNAWASQRHPS